MLQQQFHFLGRQLDIQYLYKNCFVSIQNPKKSLLNQQIHYQNATFLEAF